ncbi:hypothetical protein DFO80_1391 [Rhodobacter sp. 140A]|uniref:Uncharacterized protein n=1 Tax=bioreactor metagenome TaxID=1076179 RepID=A0A644U773_9ZZZZ|nr:hypothetical protein DFO80_1391 [Rhodobacter sp. 140A]
MKHIAFATLLVIAGTGSVVLAGGFTAPVDEPSPVVREETTPPDRSDGTQGGTREEGASRPARESATTSCSSVFDRATPACRS